MQVPSLAISIALAPLIAVGACTVKQAVQSRKAAVEYTKGAEVSAGDFERPIEHVGRIRVYASLDYQAQRSGWKTQVKKMLESADDVLGPAFALRLEVADTQVWNPECDPADLIACLAELEQYDQGEDVDWVVGLIAAVPHFTTSFEELGMARTPGRHFVLRDLYDPGEREAINAMFPAMSASKRTEIYKERQKHKRLVILLHEWGHTMGALHIRRDQMILFPNYDPEMAMFSDENLRLIDASLKDRFPFNPSYPTLAKALGDTSSDEWFPGERERLLAALGASAPAASGPSEPIAKVALAGDDAALLAGVSDEDRAHYADAKSKLEAHELEASWASLEPLVKKYPDNYAIQHFGCSLAMHVGAREAAGSACRRAISLASTE